MTLGIYRLLSKQNLVFIKEEKKWKHVNPDIDLENKQASFDAMSKSEIVLVRMKNRHKIYRRKNCDFCGSDLRHDQSKTGRKKRCCDANCTRKFILFAYRLYGSIDAENPNQRIVNMFKEYCLIQLLFRVPAQKLSDPLKKVYRKKEILLQSISRQ